MSDRPKRKNVVERFPNRKLIIIIKYIQFYVNNLNTRPNMKKINQRYLPNLCNLIIVYTYSYRDYTLLLKAVPMRNHDTSYL